MTLGVLALPQYIEATKHPSAHVREWAASGIQSLEQDGVPAADALAVLLADPDDEVRQRAFWALEWVGPGVLPVLREIRRHGPGRLRLAALALTARLAGPDGLDPRDRAAVDRLIRIKLAAERPEPIAPAGGWMAVRGGDQASIMEVLELSQPRPATCGWVGVPVPTRCTRGRSGTALTALPHHSCPRCI